MCMRICIPYTNSAVITTREQLVLVDGETPNLTSMPLYCSHLCMRICIPYTNSAVNTTREQLVLVDGETCYTTSIYSLNQFWLIVTECLKVYLYPVCMHLTILCMNLAFIVKDPRQQYLLCRCKSHSIRLCWCLQSVYLICSCISREFSSHITCNIVLLNTNISYA